MHRAALAALLLLASCASPAPPAYMRDAAGGEEEAKRAILEIRAGLGPDYTVVRVGGLFFLAAKGVRQLDLARETIDRVSRFLWRDYFRVRPAAAIRVYCLPDRTAYVEHVRKSLGREPSTPYGFYLPGERTMYLNLGTGSGTLAHEIVHPLLAEDFPSVPAWFNEGFASLFEQSATLEDGTVVAKSNWRLKGLKAAMAEKRAISLPDLLATSTSAFYGDARGVNYATARYLLLWLQDHGKLRAYYREFRDSAAADPAGRAALERTVGATLEEFEPGWRAWVEGLK